MGRPSYDPRIVDGEVIMFLVDRGEYMRTADYDALYSTAIFNRKRYEEAESRIHELEAALRDMVNRWEPDGGSDKRMWDRAVDLLKTGSPSRPENLSIGSALSDTTTDRGGKP